MGGRAGRPRRELGELELWLTFGKLGVAKGEVEELADVKTKLPASGAIAGDADWNLGDLEGGLALREELETAASQVEELADPEAQLAAMESVPCDTGGELEFWIALCEELEVATRQVEELA